MKAVAMFPASKQVKVVDIEEPKITKPTQVLAKTLKVGLCGTDREIATGDYGTPPAGSDYLVIGHECLAEVVEVGEKVSRFRPGQLVVPAVRRPCDDPDCEACRAGRPDFCLTGKYKERGIVGCHGFMCERFVDEEQYFHAVPDDLREIGVLTEPLTIAEKSLIQVRDVQDRLPYIDKYELKQGVLEGVTAVVLGAGPVGLLGALALRQAGAKVFVYSREQEPTEASKLIESTGAEYVSSECVAPDQFREMTQRIDVIYEATGASSFAFDMTQLLGRNGIFIFTGVPGRKGPVPMETARIMRDMVLKNQLLIGTVNAGPAAYEAAIHALAELHRHWPYVLDNLITATISPEQVAENLKSAKEGIKTVVNFAS